MDDTTPARSARRRQILAAAAAVFAERGYHACRIHDVAERAGVAYGLVYHYFGTKDALLQTVFDESWASFADAVTGIAASGRPAPDQVRAVLDYVFGALRIHPEVVRVVVLEYGRTTRGGEALTHPDVARTLDAMTGTFGDRAVAVALMGALEATVTSLLREEGGEGAIAARHRALLTLFRDGWFAARPSP